MLSSNSQGQAHPENVLLRVSSKDRSAEIVVVDRNLRPVARGVGMASASLSPGIYKVRVIVGSQVHEEFAVLPPGVGEKTLEIAQIAFASPAPITSTTKTHEYHMAAADEQSRLVHVARGGDSQIFIFLREYTKSGSNNADVADLAKDISLVDEQGAPVVYFDRTGERSGQPSESDRWYACNVALKAGIYRLVANRGSANALALTVVASPGWQTQIFILTDPLKVSENVAAVKLAGASVLLSRIGDGFRPDDGSFRLSELARLALSNRRKVLASGDIDELLAGKFENPMLGLLGANLLLLARPSAGRDLGNIVSNLRQLLGKHPDVESLALELDSQNPSDGFPHPPMLSESYWRVIKASAYHASIVTHDSATARAAIRRWSGRGPWLVYGEPGPAVQPAGLLITSIESSVSVNSGSDWNPATAGWDEETGGGGGGGTGGGPPHGTAFINELQSPSEEEVIEFIRVHGLNLTGSGAKNLSNTEYALLQYLVPQRF